MSQIKFDRQGNLFVVDNAYLVPDAAAAGRLGMDSDSFGPLPVVNSDSLPVAPGAGGVMASGDSMSPLAPEGAQTVLTVDDDGCAGCYLTIQAAVDAASPGDTINVNPGVYGPFLINGKNNLAVQGLHTDAVFVDGGGGAYAAKIQDATSVRIENMTLRNALNAIELDHDREVLRVGVLGEFFMALEPFCKQAKHFSADT